MTTLRRTVWSALVACAALTTAPVYSQVPCNCAPPSGYGYGPFPYGTVGPGFSGHWIYSQLSPYPASYYGAYGYGQAGTYDPRWPRVAGPDATGRSQINPAVPYRTFEEYLKSQSAVPPQGTTSPTPTPPVPTPPAVPTPPVPTPPVPTPATKGTTGTIEVHVPDAKAVVTINDEPTKQAGIVRVFQTPPLATKKMFKVHARWGNEITGPIETQFIEVGPGETKTVTFTEKKN